MNTFDKLYQFCNYRIKIQLYCFTVLYDVCIYSLTKVRRDLILNIILNFILYKPNFEIRIYIFHTLEKGAILFNKTRLTTKNLEKANTLRTHCIKNPSTTSKIFLHLDKSQ